MSYAVVQHVGHSYASDDNSVTLAWPNPTQGGNHLFMIVGTQTPLALFGGVSLPSVTGWVGPIEVNNVTDEQLHVYYAVNSASRSGTETMALTAQPVFSGLPAPWTMQLIEISGPPVNASPIASGTDEDTATVGYDGTTTFGASFVGSGAGGNGFSIAFFAHPDGVPTATGVDATFDGVSSQTRDDGWEIIQKNIAQFGSNHQSIFTIFQDDSKSSTRDLDVFWGGAADGSGFHVHPAKAWFIFSPNPSGQTPTGRQAANQPRKKENHWQLTINVRSLATGSWQQIGNNEYDSGIYPENFTVSQVMPGGTDQFQWDMKRDPRIDWPDLNAFDPVEVSIGGLKIASGRIREVPVTTDGDQVMTVICDGAYYSLLDDVLKRTYMENKLSIWKDARSFDTDKKDILTVQPTVHVHNTIQMGWRKGDVVLPMETVAVMIDLGPRFADYMGRIDIEYSTPHDYSSDYKLYVKTGDTPDDDDNSTWPPVGHSETSSGTGLGSSGDGWKNFDFSGGRSKRYISIALQNTDGNSPANMAGSQTWTHNSLHVTSSADLSDDLVNGDWIGRNSSGHWWGDQDNWYEVSHVSEDGKTITLKTRYTGGTVTDSSTYVLGSKHVQHPVTVKLKQIIMSRQTSYFNTSKHESVLAASDIIQDILALSPTVSGKLTTRGGFITPTDVNAMPGGHWFDRYDTGGYVSLKDAIDAANYHNFYWWVDGDNLFHYASPKVNNTGGLDPSTAGLIVGDTLYFWDFEDGTETWVGTNASGFGGGSGATVTQEDNSTQEPESRDFQLKIVPGGVNRGPEIKLNGVFKQGTPYTVSAWVVSASAGNITGYLGHGSDVASSDPQALDTAYAKMTWTWTPTQDEPVVYLKLVNDANVTWYADAISIQKQVPAPDYVTSLVGGARLQASGSDGTQSYNRVIVVAKDGREFDINSEIAWPDPTWAVDPDIQPTNGDFETDVSGWTAITGAIAQSATFAKHGTDSLRITSNGAKNFDVVTTAYSEDFVEGNSYMVEFWVRANADLNTMAVDVRNSWDTDTLSNIESLDANGYDGLSTGNTLRSTKWSTSGFKRYFRTFIADNDGALTLRFHGTTGSATHIAAYIDKVVIYEDVTGILGRRQLRRTAVLNMEKPVDAHGALTIGLKFLAQHGPTPPGQGTLVVQGEQMVRDAVTNEPIPIHRIRVGEALMISDQPNPDRLNTGRIYNIVGVQYDHNTRTATLNLDNTRYSRLTT